MTQVPRGYNTLKVPPPPRFTLLAFVASDHRGHIVIDWEWREADPERPGYPKRCDTDFGSQTWPKT
jgi:hypothetical protein